MSANTCACINGNRQVPKPKQGDCSQCSSVMKNYKTLPMMPQSSVEEVEYGAPWVRLYQRIMDPPSTKEG